LVLDAWNFSGVWCLVFGVSRAAHVADRQRANRTARCSVSVEASILVGLLWCLAILTVVVIGVLHTARLDLRVVKNYGDKIQAHYLALAGVEKAKALLFQDAIDRRRSAKNHSGALYDDPQDFRDVAFGRGEFRVFRRARPDEGEGLIYGVGDEESRLNVNTAGPDQLGKLQDMTSNIVAAIVDWRDADNEVTPGGAEADYYMSLQPPYRPRNGPLQTIRELLMVRGISRELLLGGADEESAVIGVGSDENGSALLTTDGFLDGGWSGVLTVDSLDNNLNAAGDDRVNIQSADEAALTGIQGITPAIARSIVAYRGQNQFQSIADLLDVTAAQNSGRGGRGGPVPPQNGGNNSGPKVISQDLLLDIADDLAVTDASQDQSGAINSNTACVPVLTCLPGIDSQLAQAIISYRKSSGSFPNIAWLLNVPGITRDIFKQIAPFVTARSETYRVLAEGKVTSSGARQRIQVIIHVGVHNIDTLSYREDL
jgi:DNA uptake protein ComE-like DNA-binding protein